MGSYRKLFLFCTSLLLFFSLIFPYQSAWAASSDTVTFPDSNLENAIRGQLGIGSDQPITVSNMESLSTLDLSNCHISDLTGLEAAKYITSLKLDHNQITNIDPLANLNYLDDVSLKNNQITSLAPLSNLIYLKTLNLVGNKISDVTSLQNLPYLSWLDLAGNVITDATSLGNLTSLKHLSISDNNLEAISFTKMKALEEFYGFNNLLTSLDFTGAPNLKTVNINHNKLNSVNLAEATQLTYLDSSDNLLTTIDLTNAQQLLSLYLSNNSISDLNLFNNSKLVYLDLSHNSLPSIDLGGATALRTADLSYNKLETVNVMNKYRSIEKIDLSHNFVKSIFTGGITISPNGLDLNLSYNPFTEVDLRGLAGTSPNGVSVDVSHTNISELGMIRFTGNVKLRQLNLSNTRLGNLYFTQIDPEGLKQIYSLDVSHNGISMLDDITPLSNLASLNLSATGITSIKSITGLASSKITSLDISNTEVSDLSDLIGMTGLENINLSGTKIDSIFPLGLLPGLKNINISNTSVNDLTPLNRLLQLSSINAENTLISDLTPLNNLKYLSQVMVSHTKITSLSSLTNKNISTLYAANNNLSDFDSINNFTNLSFLDLSGNKMTNVDPLIELQNLSWLNLEGNDLTDVSSLAKLTNLQSLDVSSNHIDRVSFLETALCSLQSLDLSDNQISDFSPLRRNLENPDLYPNGPIYMDADGGSYKKQINIANNLQSEPNDIERLKELSTLTYSISKPDVHEIRDNDEFITGKAIAGTTVAVTTSDGLHFSDVVHYDGSFKIAIPLLKAGTTVEVSVTDKAGLVSEPVSVTVKNSLPPSKPSVNEVKDQDTVVTGNAKPGTRIDISVNDLLIGSGTTGDDGSFSVSIPKQKMNTELAVMATDQFGDSSEPASVIVKDGTPPSKPFVNQVADYDTSVSGNAGEYTKVEVKINDQVISSVYSDFYGNFSITIPHQEPGTILTVTAADIWGNCSEPTQVVVKDATPPSPPVVKTVTEKDTVVTGEAEAAAKVEIKVNNSMIGVGTAGSDGKFSITIPAQNVGTKLVVMVTDLAGNVSAPTTTVVKDGTPPAKPTVSDVSDQSTAVQGQAEQGSTIRVKVNGTQIGSGYAGSYGWFTISIPLQKAGTELTITATDHAGNESEAAVFTVRDATPPRMPDVNVVTDKDTTVTGTAEAGTTVKVRIIRDILDSTTAREDGTYSLKIPLQAAGTQLIISSTDQAGYSSENTVIVKDGTAPAKPVLTKDLTDTDTTISGQTEAGARVEVQLNGSFYGYVYADGQGSFLFNISPFKQGDKITITATDFAENVSEPLAIIVKDGIPPAAPSVSTVTDQSKSITGKAEPSSKITVKNGTSVIGTSVAKADGTFSVVIALQKAGTNLTIFATDNAGNVSSGKGITVKDVTAPGVPTVNSINNKTTSVNGKTEKAATVTVKIGTKTYTAKSDVYGNYKVTIPVQNTGTSISVVAKDSSGNVSAAKTTTVARVAPDMPTVNAVNNKSTSVAGKTEKYANVTISIGAKTYNAKADVYGNYKVVIPVQNTGTSISITAKDSSGNVSAAKTATVVRVAPDMPTVNAVTNKSTSVTGKTEKVAIVTVKIGTKTYTVNADVYGNYKVAIPVQNTGTNISITATDSKGNVSAAKTATVVRVAPNMPTVNAVTNKSTSVTGKTEKYAIVTVKIGTKTYTAKADVYGNYKVAIPAQVVGTKIYVNAKDAAGMVSATRSVTVSN